MSQTTGRHEPASPSPLPQLPSLQTLPSAELIVRVRALIESVGQVRAAAHLGMARQTMMAICAGLPVRRASIALAEQRAPMEDA